MFSQRQNPKNVKIISDDIINNLVKTELFDDFKLNNRLLELHKYLLKLSKYKNKNWEVGILWDLVTDNYIVIFGDENSISLSSNEHAKKLLKEAKLSRYVFLHNHPKCTLFSSADLKTFCNNSSILAMTAVCNDGRIHIMRKLNPYTFDGDSLLYIYMSEHYKNNNGMSYIIKNHTKLGLLYRCSVTKIRK